MTGNSPKFWKCFRLWDWFAVTDDAMEITEKDYNESEYTRTETILTCWNCFIRERSSIM